MVDPVVTIEPTHVSVQPGGQARVVVTIANLGSIVDGYRVDVVDEVSGHGVVSGPSRWSQVLLADGPEQTGRAQGSVSVYPQQRAQVVIVFSPGSGPDVPGGTFAFGVRVVSVVDRFASAVAEGDVEIGRVFGLQAKLLPVSSVGRWSGNHVVQISNWGNAPARLRLAPSDPDQALGYLVRPAVVDVPLGGSVSARVKVRTRRPRLRGQVSRLPFSIVGEPDPPVYRPGPESAVPDPGRPVVDGVFSQKPILSRAVVTATVLTVVAALAVGGVAFATRPQASIVGEVGVPPTPVLSSVVAVSPTQIRVSWVPEANVTGYKLVVSGAADDAKTLDKDLGATVVPGLDAQQRYCFQLKALRGEVSSPPSPPSCATTKAPPVTGTSSGSPPTSPTTPTGSSTTTTSPPPVEFAATDWIAMVYTRRATDPGAQKDATDLQATLAGRNSAAHLLLSSAYPKLTRRFDVPTWVLYLGPFGSSAAAADACAVVRTSTLLPCELAQPAPATTPQPSPTGS